MHKPLPSSISCLVFFLLSLASINAQSIYQLNEYIENPKRFEENQEPPRVSAIPYLTREGALAADPTTSPFFLSLDGAWKFQWRPNALETAPDFHQGDFDASQWDSIQVPGTWQTQGYGYNIYRNVGQAFTPYDPPHVPDHLNPVGEYLRWFEVPAPWEDREVYLHFEGVKSAFFIWINGKYLGYDQGSMTPAEFNVTEFVQPGSNQIALRVFRWSDGSYLEDQDMWRFSGIYRSVYLYSAPRTRVRDHFVKTDLDDSYRDAELSVEAELQSSPGAPSGPYRLVAELYDSLGNLVTSVEESGSAPNAGSRDQVRLVQDVEAPLKWSAEKPNLYSLLLILEGSEGQIREIYRTRVGFREIERRGSQVLINGVPVEFKGVNRHEHDPQQGRTVSREVMKRDLELMKQFNINAVRLSHYPNDPEWYDLADEYGVYLVDEVNAECHGDETLSEDPAWNEAFVDRFSRMLERDKNHPSIILWSTGNECGLGLGSFAMAEYKERRDPTRLLYHQGNPRGFAHPSGDAPFADVNGIRYPSPARLRDHGRSSAKPVVMGEYSHALANSCGHLDEYWDLIFAEPTLQGGFIWDWVDQALEQDLVTIRDESGQGNFGAFVGRPQLVDGRSGQGLALSGIDEWVEIYTGPSLDLEEEIMLDLWVYPREWHGHNPLLSRSEHFTLEQSGRDTLEFAVFTPERLAVEIEVPTEWEYNWHHVIAIFDGEAISVGIDGDLVIRSLIEEKELAPHLMVTSPSLRMIPSQYPLNLGRNWWENHENYQGWTSNSIFDDVRIFSSIAGETELWNRESDEDLVLALDFESSEAQGRYLTYGATPWASGTLDGIISADRTPQPELYQVKKSQQPVRVEAVDLSQGIFSISNRFDFTNLDEVQFTWAVESVSQQTSWTEHPLSLDPHDSTEIDLPVEEFEASPGELLFLTMRFVTSSEAPGRPAGHEIAFAQFLLPRTEAEEGRPTQETALLDVLQNPERLIVKGEDFSLAFDRSSGRLSRYEFRGQSLLERGPELNIWRAPTLNEMSIWNEPESQEWYALGLHKMEHRLENLSYRRLESQSVVVEVITHSTPPGRSHGFENIYRYEVLASGRVVLTHEAIPFGELPWLPKLGLQLELPAGMENVEYFGRGPFENYPDRKTAARFGRYKTSTRPQQISTPYVYPQEHGNHSDVFWVAVEGATQTGLAIFGEEMLHLNLDPYTNLDRAVYDFQLETKETTTLHIDHQVTGMGGTPINVRPRYRTYPRHYRYQILLQPYDRAETTPQEIARQAFAREASQ